MNELPVSWLDIVLLLPLLIGLVKGLIKGVIAELMAIVAILLGILGARLWGGGFAAWMLHQFAWPQAVCNAVAYTLLFIVIALLTNLLARLLSRLMKAIHLGALNRIAGGLFGIAKWAIVVLALVFCLGQLDRNFHFIPNDLKKHSPVYNEALELSGKMMGQIQAQTQLKTL